MAPRAQYVSLSPPSCGSGGSGGRENPLSSLFSTVSSGSNPTLSANLRQTLAPLALPDGCAASVSGRDGCPPKPASDASVSGEGGRTLLLLGTCHPQVISRRTRWRLGTLHGVVTPEPLDAYLEECRCRFTRRRSRRRGQLFSRLVQQAVAVDPAPYASLVKHLRSGKRRR